MYFKTIFLITLSYLLIPSGGLYGFGFKVQENGKSKTVSIPEHTESTLENTFLRVLPKAGSAVQAKNDFFEGSNASENNQIQAYYLSVQSYEILKDMFDEAPDELLEIYVDDVIYENPNNALFIHENGQPKILLGKGDNKTFKPLSQSKDYIMHEMAHYFMDDYFDSHRGEPGVLQEGLSDFFVYMSGDNRFGNDARIDGKSIRSAQASGKFDDPNNSQTLHQLGEYLSTILYTMSEKIGKEAVIELTVNSIKNLQDQQTLERFFINLENNIEEEDYCDYESSLITHGFVQYLQNQENHCGEDLIQLKTLSKSRYEFDARNLDLSFIDNAEDETNSSCGQISKKHSSSYPSLLLILCLPLLMVYLNRGENYEY